MITSESYTRISLALDIVGKIPEGPWKGYHELGIIKHQIDLHDTISMEPSRELSIRCNDNRVPCDESNICIKAVKLMQQECGIDENVEIRLEKRIPVMGGLAGGSANAATVLSMLNDLWDLEMDDGDLMLIGRRLGMDVPFFFTGGTAFDTETASFPESIETSLEMSFVLAIPDFGISTREAYEGIDYSMTGKNQHRTDMMRNAFACDNLDTIVREMHNDFEISVFPRYPLLAEIKERLIRNGCRNAVMSGSGSTIIGITEDREHALDIQNKLGLTSIISSTFIRK